MEHTGKEWGQRKHWCPSRAAAPLVSFQLWGLGPWSLPENYLAPLLCFLSHLRLFLGTRS